MRGSNAICDMISKVIKRGSDASMDEQSRVRLDVAESARDPPSLGSQVGQECNDIDWRVYLRTSKPRPSEAHRATATTIISDSLVPATTPFSETTAAGLASHSENIPGEQKKRAKSRVHLSRRRDYSLKYIDQKL